MRRFPSSWKNTLAALGLRRRVKKTPSRSSRHGVARLELLERRELLSGSPNEPIYSFVASEAPGAYDPASQFILATEYATETGEPLAVLKLREDLTDETLRFTLQEIGLELRQGSQVLETQTILVDIAEPDFLEKFQADRADQAGQEPALAAGSATVAGVPLETLLDSEGFNGGRDSGQIGAATAIAYYDAFTLTLRDASTRATSGEASAEEQISASEEAYQLSAAGLRLVGRIAIDRASDNAALGVAADSLRNALAEYGTEYHTAFAGLGHTDEVVREWRQSGAEEFVLALVDEPIYQASDRFRIELADLSAMVQVSIVSGAGFATAASQATFNDTATKDVTVASDQSATNLDGQTLVAKQTAGGDASEALFTIPLTNHAGAVPDSALVEIQADSITTAGTARISAHWDFWGQTAPAIVGPDFDETSLTWDTHQASLASGFRGSLDDQFISAPGDYSFDVTEAVQRALTAGDANVDGEFNAVTLGYRGDIEAMYQAVRDWDAYVAIYAAAAGTGGTVNGTEESLRHRTDLDWDGDTDASDYFLAADRLGFLKGDFNIDGVIDGYDYSLWQENYGRSASLLQHGDGNADGITQTADYTVWRDGEGKAHGSPLPTAITFRVTADSSTEIAFDSTEAAGSWGGATPKPAELTSLAASDVVLTHFAQATAGFGWDLGYRVLNEAWTAGIDLEVLADGQSVYTATGLSAGVGANTRTVDPSQINLIGAVETLTLVLKSGSNELSRRDFAGGLFADSSDAWRYYGTEQDDEIAIDDRSIAIGSAYSVTAAGVLQSGFNGAFTQTVYFDSPTNTPYGGTAPTAIYVNAGDGLDLIRNELSLSPVFWADGGSGDDTYDLTTPSNQLVHDAQVTIDDASGIDGLLLSSYARLDDTLDLASVVPQLLDDDVSGYDLTVTFGSDRSIQHVGTALFPGVLGPGYSDSLFVVDTLDHVDDGLLGEGQLSLREAVRLSELIAGAHTIEFDPSVYTGVQVTQPIGDDQLTAVDGDAFNITQELTVIGPGQDVLTLDAEGKSRAFIVRAGAELTLTDVTIENGAVYGNSDGGGIHVRGALTVERTTWRNHFTNGGTSWSGGNGGAIYARNADLTIRDSTFEGNDARYAGAVYFRPDSGQQLLIERSTFNDNQAVNRNGKGGFGAAIVHTAWSTVPGSLMRMENSTVSENYAQYGGIIWVNGSGSDTRLMTEIVNSTIVHNTVDGSINGGAGLYNASNGRTTLYNTILADNVKDADGTGDESDLFIHNTDRLTGSNNLIGLSSQSASQIDGALPNGIRISASQDAGLLPLGEYGGVTQSHALDPNSLAINAGDNDQAIDISYLPLLDDQRANGFGRVFDNTVDIGAHESLVVSEGQGASQVVTIFGSEYDDIFASQNNEVLVRWGDGGDYRVAIDPQAAVSISGGQGADTIDASGLLASSVSLSGGDGDDTIIGTSGPDLINGGWGNDRLEGGPGDDHLRGGRGNDTYAFSGSEALGTDEIVEFVIGDPTGEDSGWDIYRLGGQDTLDFSGADFGVGVDIDLSDGVSGQSSLREVLKAGQDVYLRLDLGGLGLLIEDVIGTQYDDTIRGNENRNRLDGRGGNDQLDGGTGGILIAGEDTFVVSDRLSVDSHYTITGASATAFIDLSGWGGELVGLDIADTSTQSLAPATAIHSVEVQLSPGVIDAVVGFDVPQDGIATAPPVLIVDDPSELIDTNYTPGNLSLREALILARAEEGPNQIILATPVPLLSGALELDSDVSVLGASVSSRIALESRSGERILNAYHGLQVEIDSLTLEGGGAAQSLSAVFSGGAIQSESNLEVRNSFFIDNAANAGGGAIYQLNGALWVANTVFSRNRVRESVFGFGGAVSIAGADVVIERATFTDNTAARSGGAIHQIGGDLEVRRSQFDGNRAMGQGSFAGGGAINVRGGNNLLIEDVVLAGNSAEALGAGGAIVSEMHDTFVTRSAIYGNEADVGGGLHIAARGKLLITNTTIGENYARTRGGGVFLNYSDAPREPIATITNATIVNNAEAPRGSTSNSRGAGIEIGDGYPAPDDARFLELNNTILTDNLWTDGTQANIHPAVFLAESSRNNLFSPGGNGGLVHDPNGTGNMILGVSEAVGLSPLRGDANGTIVYALDEASVAVDSGDNSRANRDGAVYGQSGEARFSRDGEGQTSVVNIGASEIVLSEGEPVHPAFLVDPAIAEGDTAILVAGEPLELGRVVQSNGNVVGWTAKASVGADNDVAITPEGLVLWTPTLDISGGVVSVAFQVGPDDRSAVYQFGLTAATFELGKDTDGDGIDDVDEAAVHLTDPFRVDTDGDGVYDGDEVVGEAIGFDPLVPLSDEELMQDQDGDGILTLDEIELGSNPVFVDTDNDGVLDGTEIILGSGPADPSDGGNPGFTRHMRVTVGDQSGSSSEQWEMLIRDESENVVFRVEPPIGEVVSRTFSFTTGAQYSLEMVWITGDKDYDYFAEVSATIGGRTINSQSGRIVDYEAGIPIALDIYDPDSILGTRNNIQPSDFVDLRAYFTQPSQGLLLEGLSDPDEDTRPAVLPLNDNDSNGSGVDDRQEPLAWADKDRDWRLLQVDKGEVDPGETYLLQYDSHIRLWEHNGAQWTLQSGDLELDPGESHQFYVEGFSEGVGGIQLGKTTDGTTIDELVDSLSVNVDKLLMQAAKINDSGEADVFNPTDGALSVLDGARKDKGAFLPVNSDDDNDNGITDSSERALSAFDAGDLLPVGLQRIDRDLDGTYGNVRYSLRVGATESSTRTLRNEYRVFEKQPDDTYRQIGLGSEINFGNQSTKTVYLEARSAAKAQRVLKFEAEITHAGGATTTIARDLYITPLRLEGPQNVAATAIHQYEISGANGAFITPRHGSVRGATATSQTVAWDQTSEYPSVGKVRYQASDSYTWAFHVNVITVEIDFSDEATKARKGNTPPEEYNGEDRILVGLDNPPEYVSSADFNFSAMRTQITVDAMRGPDVVAPGGTTTIENRGARGFELGFIQTITPTVWRANFAGNTTRTHVEEGAIRLDAVTVNDNGRPVNNTLPWYDTAGLTWETPNSPAYFNTSTERSVPDGGFAGTFTMGDRPISQVAETNLFGGVNPKRLESIDHRLEFTTYFAIASLDEDQDKRKYTQLARFNWAFVADGNYDSAGRWTSDGAGIEVGEYSEVTTGQYVPLDALPGVRAGDVYNNVIRKNEATKPSADWR